MPAQALGDALRVLRICTPVQSSINNALRLRLLIPLQLCEYQDPGLSSFSYSISLHLTVTVRSIILTFPPYRMYQLCSITFLIAPLFTPPQCVRYQLSSFCWGCVLVSEAFYILNSQLVYLWLSLCQFHCKGYYYCRSPCHPKVVVLFGVPNFHSIAKTIVGSEHLY